MVKLNRQSPPDHGSFSAAVAEVDAEQWFRAVANDVTVMIPSLYPHLSESMMTHAFCSLLQFVTLKNKDITSTYSLAAMADSTSAGNGMLGSWIYPTLAHMYFWLIPKQKNLLRKLGVRRTQARFLQFYAAFISVWTFQCHDSGYALPLSHMNTDAVGCNVPHDWWENLFFLCVQELTSFSSPLPTSPRSRTSTKMLSSFQMRISHLPS
jgi:hypothetical protein